MKPTIPIALSILALILVSGCVQDRTPEFCGVLKQRLSSNKSVEVNYDGVCVVSTVNATHPQYHYLKCKTFTQYVNFLIVSNKSHEIDSSKVDIDCGFLCDCKITEIK